VIVLGEHVTYWDRQGWKDRFSAEVFTERQEAYGRRFHLESVYTPQLVVNGQAEMVGSDEARARQEIQHAAKQPSAKVDIALAPDQAVAIAASGLPAQARGADVILAITETRLDTDVKGGENGGRKLRHTGVVRTMTRVGRIDDAKSGNYTAQAHYRLDPAWKRENVKIVVFLEDPDSRKIWGAAAVRP
jgi:hypothetical protein